MANSTPTLSDLSTPFTFLENTVNAAPLIIDADVTFSDLDNNAIGFIGKLTVSGLLAEDTVAIRHQGTGAGQIGIDGNLVLYGNIAIGSFTGGAGSTFTVTFGSLASAPAVDALIQNLTYANSSNTPTASRTLKLKITDTAGAAAAAPLAFTAQTSGANPFNGVDLGELSAPRLADLDGDGDLDALVGKDNGSLIYFKNTGSAIAPVFTEQTGAANPFDGVDVGDFSTPSFGDLDGDGDVDAIVGEDNGTLNYFKNTGSASAPVFAAQTGAANPLDGVDVGFGSKPVFADLDGDGDLDAIVGENNGTLKYFRNTGSAIAPAFTEQTGAANPFDGVDVGFGSNPVFADLDGDGDLDAIVAANNVGTLNYFENTGSATAPAFTARTGAANPFNDLDVGDRGKPSFGDLDGDGDLDVVLGTGDGVLNYLTNTTPQAITPDFAEQTGAANPLNGIDAGTGSAPSFADLDGDGDLDALVANSSGALKYFRNTGSAIAPAFTEQTGGANPFDGFSGGINSVPTFGDLDGDSDLDVIVGDAFGSLNYFRNTGTTIGPAFTQETGGANPFDGVDVGEQGAPSLADLDGDGDLDAVVANSNGTLKYFRNTGSATAPAFTEQTGGSNPFDGFNAGFFSTPSFADLDGDGDLDAIVGVVGGTLNYFKNTGSATAPAFTAQTGAANPFNGIDVGSFSRPSFADLDGDGDLDMVVGEDDGNLNYFKNTGAGFELVVNVTAQNDAPVITSNGGGSTSAVSIAENTTAVTTVAATDADSSPLTYSIAGGADAARFQINASTGALSFVAAPNFEAPNDADVNNSYVVQVRASDGSLADDQTITVNVGNANDLPSPSPDDGDGNPLFDTPFYLAQNGDVAQAGANALAHFNSFGFKEGRDPSAFFDTSFYLAVNQDVKAAGVNPLTHFDQSGWKEGRVPSVNFDPAAYLSANPDVKAAGIDPLAHFMQFGAAEGRQAFAVTELLKPNGFDFVFYLANNPDVAAAGVDPFGHFQTTGWTEGRRPNALFDTAGYLANYADVKNAGINPLDHYNQFGFKEGRDPSTAFDTTDYLGANPDVAAAGINPLSHYLDFGRHEGRSAFNDGVWG